MWSVGRTAARASSLQDCWIWILFCHLDSVWFSCKPLNTLIDVIWPCWFSSWMFLKQLSCVSQDDVQTILHHQLLKQQQEEQAQKKPKGFAVLRRSNKPLPQKPDYATLAHTPVSTPRSPAATQRWKDKFRRGKITTQEPVESQPQMSVKEDNFQTVSLDWRGRFSDT